MHKQLLEHSLCISVSHSEGRGKSWYIGKQLDGSLGWHHRQAAGGILDLETQAIGWMNLWADTIGRSLVKQGHPTGHIVSGSSRTSAPHSGWVSYSSCVLLDFCAVAHILELTAENCCDLVADHMPSHLFLIWCGFSELQRMENRETYILFM